MLLGYTISVCFLFIFNAELGHEMKQEEEDEMNYLLNRLFNILEVTQSSRIFGILQRDLRIFWKSNSQIVQSFMPFTVICSIIFEISTVFIRNNSFIFSSVLMAIVGERTWRKVLLLSFILVS